MDQEQRLAQLELRLARLEALLRAGTPPSEPAAASASAPSPVSAPAFRPPTVEETRQQSLQRPLQQARPPRASTAPKTGDGGNTGLVLGFLAGACLLLAAIFMVKMAVDSGWLTPVRQIALVVMFGCALIATHFFRWKAEARYFSLLPGLGVAVLNIAVYGALYVHRLIDPPLAFWLTQGLGALCLGLYSATREDLFVIAAVVGTHIGALVLGTQETSLDLIVCATLWTWSAVFSWLAIGIGARKLITVVAYFGFATALSLGSPFVHSPIELITACIYMLALFLVYLGATIAYSIRHAEPLDAEAVNWLYPPLLLFYVTEYSWCSKILPEATPYLFLGLALTVFGAYQLARKDLRGQLPSTRLVYLFVATVFLHVVYFQLLVESFRPVAGLLIAGAAYAFRNRLDYRGGHLGIGVVAVLCGSIGYIQVFLGEGAVSDSVQVLNGVLYGSAALAVGIVGQSRRTGPAPILDAATTLAHLQWIVALYRFRGAIGIEALSLSVTLLWIAYAFTVFSIGWSMRLTALCRSCLFILCFCVGKLFVYDMWNQSAGIRVVSLLGMGVALYLFGLLFRRLR